MLSPIKPRDDSPAEQARYEADLEDQKQHPERWGRPLKPGASAGPVAARFGEERDDLRRELNELKAQQADPVRTARIVAAMAKMVAEDEGLGKDGVPDVKAVQKATGLSDVNAAERDECWALLQNPKPVEAGSQEGPAA